MALETATYISGLVAANPLSTDPKSQGDDHLRLIKSTLQATFPNITGAVTATHTELSYVSGVTSGIQGQLDAITAQLVSGGTALNQISAASASSTIDNAANQINWNWNLTGASGKGFAVSESAASTLGAGAQDLVSFGTLSGSTANAFRVTAHGANDAILVRYNGAVTISSVKSPSSSSGPSLSLNAANGSTSSNGGSVQITPGDGGDIVLNPGGDGFGRVDFASNSSVNKSTVASAFTANVGPTGASTAIVGWLAIKVGGTARYIPYW